MGLLKSLMIRLHLPLRLSSRVRTGNHRQQPARGSRMDMALGMDRFAFTDDPAEIPEDGQRRYRPARKVPVESSVYTRLTPGSKSASTPAAMDGPLAGEEVCKTQPLNLSGREDCTESLQEDLSAERNEEPQISLEGRKRKEKTAANKDIFFVPGSAGRRNPTALVSKKMAPASTMVSKKMAPASTMVFKKMADTVSSTMCSWLVSRKMAAKDMEVFAAGAHAQQSADRQCEEKQVRTGDTVGGSVSTGNTLKTAQDLNVPENDICDMK